jgi:hypothetical protein
MGNGSNFSALRQVQNWSVVGPVGQPDFALFISSLSRSGSFARMGFARERDAWVYEFAPMPHHREVHRWYCTAERISSRSSHRARAQSEDKQARIGIATPDLSSHGAEWRRFWGTNGQTGHRHHILALRFSSDPAKCGGRRAPTRSCMSRNICRTSSHVAVTSRPGGRGLLLKRSHQHP